jgi:hypothetical protein
LMKWAWICLRCLVVLHLLIWGKSEDGWFGDGLGLWMIVFIFSWGSDFHGHRSLELDY